MKLIVAIVSQSYSGAVVDKLTQAGYRATLISTRGGFRGRGNVTLLIGVEAAQCEDALAKVSVACRAHPGSGSTDSGAIVFVLNMDQYQRM